MSGHKHMRGLALIAALLFVAIALMLATAITISLRLLIHQAELSIGADQLTSVLSSVQYWAEEIIIQKYNINQIRDFNVVVNGIHIHGKIIPQQGLFNVNSLSDKNNFSYFNHLLAYVYPNLSLKENKALTLEIHKWITQSDADNIYLRLDLPYRASHQMMIHVSELRLVSGMSAPIFNALRPYVSALPTTDNHIDINYTSFPVLSTLLFGKIVLAREMIACRDQYGVFDSVDAFLAHCSFGVATSRNLIAKDHYFLVRAIARRGDQSIQLDRFIKSSELSKGKFQFVVIWQEING